VRRWWVLSLALFVAAIALIIASVATGEGQVGLFLIFPFIIASGPLALAGSALLLLAIISVFIAFWKTGEAARPDAGGSDAAVGQERKFGGVVMIGPIPIAFGSDKRMAKWMAVAGIILFVVLIIAYMILVHQLF